MNIQPEHLLVHRREAERKHLTLDLPGVESESTADWRVIYVDELSIQSQVSCVPRVVISAHNEFLRVTVFSENVGCSSIEFDSVRHDHVRHLNVKAIVANGAHRYLPVSGKMIQFS